MVISYPSEVKDGRVDFRPQWRLTPSSEAWMAEARFSLELGSSNWTMHRFVPGMSFVLILQRSCGGTQKMFGSARQREPEGLTAGPRPTCTNLSTAMVFMMLFMSSSDGSTACRLAVMKTICKIHEIEVCQSLRYISRFPPPVGGKEGGGVFC